MRIKRNNIAVDNFIENYIPIRLRKVLRLIVLRIIFSPIKTLSNEYQIWREESVTRAYVTGETMSMEWYLNLIMSSGTDIYIESAGVSGVPIGLETIPTELGIYLNAGLEASEAVNYFSVPLVGEDTLFGNASFVVYVPVALAGSEALIVSIVNQYKAAGKIYKIIYY